MHARRREKMLPAPVLKRLDEKILRPIGILHYHFVKLRHFGVPNTSIAQVNLANAFLPFSLRELFVPEKIFLMAVVAGAVTVLEVVTSKRKRAVHQLAILKTVAAVVKIRARIDHIGTMNRLDIRQKAGIFREISNRTVKIPFVSVPAKHHVGILTGDDIHTDTIHIRAIVAEIADGNGVSQFAELIKERLGWIKLEPGLRKLAVEPLFVSDDLIWTVRMHKGEKRLVSFRVRLLPNRNPGRKTHQMLETHQRSPRMRRHIEFFVPPNLFLGHYPLLSRQSTNPLAGRSRIENGFNFRVVVGSFAHTNYSPIRAN